MHLNLDASMVPGLSALVVGAVFCFGAKKLCRKEKDVPLLKAIGLAMALCGTVLVFL